MLAYIFRRSLIAVGTVWAVSVISFVIISLPPGDYVTSYIASQQASGSYVNEQEAYNLRQQYGLGRPMYVQYAKWMTQLAERQLWSVHGVAAAGQRRHSRPAAVLTVVLALAALVFSWALAFPIGIYSAVKRYSIGDYSFTFVGMIGLAIPDFLLGLVLMYMGFKLFGANIGGLFSPEYVGEPWSVGRVWDMLKHLWIPAIIIGTAGTAALIRIMRANLLDEIRKPYVLTARAKGLPEQRLLLKYPVRVALNPFVSTVGYTFPYLVSGSIIVSIVLSLPTVGPLLLKALLAQDMFLAGTIILLIGLMTVIGTLISDILLVWIDPRIRLGA